MFLKTPFLLALLIGCAHGTSFDLRTLYPRVKGKEDPVPVAQLHGMGGTCINQLMTDVTQTLEDAMQGSFVHCFQLGATPEEDRNNTFVKTIDEQIEMFAEQVKNMKEFEKGFNVLAFSQGTSIARGYIQKFAWQKHYPEVLSFISIHGPLLGVSTLPQCNADSIAGQMQELCEHPELFYTEAIQNSLAQSNGYRNPMMIDLYLEHCRTLPVLNGERKDKGVKVKGLDRLKQFVMVKALNDTIVIPKESEWMGFYKDGSLDEILAYDETVFYKKNMFGLKTLDKKGRLFFETTPGGHTKVTMAEIQSLVEKYWKSEKHGHH